MHSPTKRTFTALIPPATSPAVVPPVRITVPVALLVLWIVLRRSNLVSLRRLDAIDPVTPYRSDLRNYGESTQREVVVWF